jgi:hypothetical protein
MSAQSSIKVYNCFVKQIESQLNMQLSDALLQDKLVYNHIENQTVTPITKRNKHFQILKYIKLNNLEPSVDYEFDKQPIKVDRKELPKRAELRAKLANITSVQDKLVLSLLLNYEQVLRTDLALVKCKDYTQDEPRYVDGVIIFPTIKKTNHKNLQIKLLPEDILLVDTSKLYLIDSIKSVDRCNSYTKYIKKITKKHFDIELTQNSMRKAIERELIEELGITDEWIATYKKLRIETAKRGHCLDTVFEYYA